jgi:hypothetical protein
VLKLLLAQASRVRRKLGAVRLQEVVHLRFKISFAQEVNEPLGQSSVSHPQTCSSGSGALLTGPYRQPFSTLSWSMFEEHLILI